MSGKVVGAPEDQPQTPASVQATLLERLPPVGETIEPAEILDRFLDWVAAAGLEPYPAQEDALLELMAGHHVVLSTPTGSGKSLVAEGLHFKALCEGQWSFYTSPTKALASEKFFDLCNLFGPANVGMLTGDASVNPEAPIVCATAEILSNMVLRAGPSAAPPYVVMDEFHYYADPQRGVAWQVPLISCPSTCFLLMSATLGDVSHITRRLERDTGRRVALISSATRPVPLDFEYRETPIQETVEYLVANGKAPIYIVSFTHDECSELAQGLTSLAITPSATRDEIAAAIAPLRFSTPYGRELRRFLRFGIGVHHAGLLPRYRLLVEQLAQRGLLKIICGTDTLGVGVNIPIRTVLFSRLSKYDGARVRILTARDFKQIAGRGGRKGFDEFGSVVCQAPEHVIAKKRATLKAISSGKKRHLKKKPPPKGFVVWDKSTFAALVARPPERLVSQFRVTHGMILNLLQRDPALPEDEVGYRALVDLVHRSHEEAERKPGLLRNAAELTRALLRSGLVAVAPDEEAGRNRLLVSDNLQQDFSLHQTLSLYLVDGVLALDREQPDYGLMVLTLVESIIEDPRRILSQQERQAKSELVARLKAERVPYEERMRQLEDVTYPRPNEEFIRATFDIFARHHPWVGHEDIRPKSVARELYESYSSFDDYVRRYGLARSEGLLLRYIGRVYKTLVQTVPEWARDDDVHEIVAFLRALLGRVDTSLVDEWERLTGIQRLGAGEEAPAGLEGAYDLAADRPALQARIRVEMRNLVRALAAADYEEAARWVSSGPDDCWDAARFEAALEPFFKEHAALVFEPALCKRRDTVVQPTDQRKWDVMQVLYDSEGDNLWYVAGEVDLTNGMNPAEPLVRPYDIRM